MTLEDLYRMLRTGHVQAQGIVDTIQVPLVVLDRHLCVVNANPAFLEAFHVTRDETIGESFLELGSGQWSGPELEELLRKVIPRSAAILAYEVSHDFPHIGRRTMLVSARRLSYPESDSHSMLVVFEDVTEARSTVSQQDLIAAEIRHRFKNFLALVASLARQSPADGVTAAEYRDTLLGRINALAEAELSVFGNESADLKELMERLMTPYKGRVTIENGRELRLEARQAASLSMVLHELATNAAKHGALSVPEGRVTLSAAPAGGEQPRLELAWRETGGPPPKAAAREGFGSRLIQMIVTQQLCGHAEMRFGPEGLVADISFPLVKS